MRIHSGSPSANDEISQGLPEVNKRTGGVCEGLGGLGTTVATAHISILCITRYESQYLMLPYILYERVRMKVDI